MEEWDTLCSPMELSSLTLLMMLSSTEVRVFTYAL